MNKVSILRPRGKTYTLVFRHPLLKNKKVNRSAKTEHLEEAESMARALEILLSKADQINTVEWKNTLYNSGIQRHILDAFYDNIEIKFNIEVHHC